VFRTVDRLALLEKSLENLYGRLVVPHRTEHQSQVGAGDELHGVALPHENLDGALESCSRRLPVRQTYLDDGETVELRGVCDSVAEPRPLEQCQRLAVGLDRRVELAQPTVDDGQLAQVSADVRDRGVRETVAPARAY